MEESDDESDDESVEDGDGRGTDDGQRTTGGGSGSAGGTTASAVERARELQAELVTLRLRERTANFENREALRRAIRERERELRSLGVEPSEDGGENGT